MHKAYQEKSRPTCINLSDHLIFVGFSTGELLCFAKDNHQIWARYHDSGKEYINNAITCIDVHQKRSEYVVVGYDKGQLILVDTTETKKVVKKINDHHKNTSVVNVKFCDWIKERNLQDVIQQSNKRTISKKEDKQNWMFVSTDLEGKVLVNIIESVMGFKKASKIMVIDPKKDIDRQSFPSIACKFYEAKYPQRLGNEGASLIAMGSQKEVVIHNVIKEKVVKLFSVSRPLHYPSQNMHSIVQFQKAHHTPCLAWGYGRTPFFKDETYVLLAVAWGPLLQIIVVRDVGS